jgi:glutamate carboxypeptidase
MSKGTAELQLRIEKCAEILGKEINWRGTGGASDGNKFAAAGLPNIDTLGPRGGDIHSMDEYLIPESLVPSAKLVTLILLSFANEI